MLDHHETAHVPPKPPISTSPTIGSTALSSKHEGHYKWVYANMKYVPIEAKREAEHAILAAQAEAEWHRSEVLAALAKQHSAEGRAAEVERQRSVDLQAAEDLRAVQAQEFEDRIQALERTLEAERRLHQEELRSRERRVQEVRDQCELLLEQGQRQCAEAMRAAEARARDAEEQAGEAHRRANESIDAARSKEEVRVKEARDSAEARARRLEAKHSEEIERLRAEIALEKKSWEEKIRSYAKQAQNAAQEAKRRIDKNEKSMQVWTSTKETQMAKTEGQLNEFAEEMKKSRAELEKHHRTLLSLEQDAHRRVMSRTMDRVVQSLKYGSDFANQDIWNKENFEALEADYSTDLHPVEEQRDALLPGSIPEESPVL